MAQLEMFYADEHNFTHDPKLCKAKVSHSIKCETI